MGLHSWNQLPAPMGFCPPLRMDLAAARPSLSDAQEQWISELEMLARLLCEVKSRRGLCPDSRIMPAPGRRLWTSVPKSSLSSWRLDDCEQAPYLLVAIRTVQVYGSTDHHHDGIFTDCLPIRQFVLAQGLEASELAKLVFDLRTF